MVGRIEFVILAISLAAFDNEWALSASRRDAVIWPFNSLATCAKCNVTGLTDSVVPVKCSNLYPMALMKGRLKACDTTWSAMSMGLQLWLVFIRDKFPDWSIQLHGTVTTE